MQLKEYKNFVIRPNAKGELENGSYNRIWKSWGGYCGAVNLTKEMEIIVKKVGTIGSGKFAQRTSYYDVNGLAPTCDTCQGGNRQTKIKVDMVNEKENNELDNVTEYRIRKLTPKECFRLMGVDDEDADKIASVVSKSQQYKLAGNSIVVDVLTAIFDKLYINKENENQQLDLF